jgi:arabinofuranan 3-O-arabinosyltransferase
MMTVTAEQLPTRKLFSGLDARTLASMVAGGLAVAYPMYLFLMFQSHDWIMAANGRPSVTDFLVFWLAGQSALKGAAAAAYVPQLHHAAEVAAAGHGFSGQLPWRYAPLFLFVAEALALLPYLWAFLAWVAASLALYAFVVSRIAGTRLAMLLACAVPAVFINSICGQNGPLTAALIGGALLFLEDRPILSGICLALLAYKPQFGILFPLVLLAGGYWRVLISAAVASLVEVLVCWAAFGAATLKAFVHYLPITSNSLLVHGANGFNKLETVYGMMRWLGSSNQMAWSAQAIVIVALAVALLWLWRREVPFTLKAATLAAATLLATPHLYMYDFAVLAVSFAFLYRERAFDTIELIGIGFANLCIGLFLFFPTPIGLVAIATTFALIARRVMLCGDASNSKVVISAKLVAASQ